MYNPLGLHQPSYAMNRTLYATCVHGQGALTHEKLGCFQSPDFDLGHGPEKMRNVLIAGSET